MDSLEMKMTFGEQIRQWRAEQRISLRDLAERSGIGFPYLSKIETNVLPPPSAETVLRIADALGKDADTLLQLAAKVPHDLAQIIMSSRELPSLLRAVRGLSDQEIRTLRTMAEQFHGRPTSNVS